MVDLRDFPSLW